MVIKKSFSNSRSSSKFLENDSRNIFMTRSGCNIRLSAAARDEFLPSKYLRIEVSDGRTIKISKSESESDYGLTLFNGQASFCYQYLKHFIELPNGKRIFLHREKEGCLVAELEENSLRNEGGSGAEQTS